MPGSDEIVRVNANACVGNSTEVWIRVQGLLCLVIFAASMVMADPSDERSWLACEQNADCTVIQLGCVYWQPVNKKYIDAMKAAHPPSCRSVTSPGPKPTAICSNRSCVNGPFTAKDWELWPSGDRWQFVAERMYACLKDTMDVNDFISLRDSLEGTYAQNIDGLIHEKQVRDNKPLNEVAEMAMSCDDLKSKARSLQKK